MTTQLAQLVQLSEKKKTKNNTQLRGDSTALCKYL